MITAPVRSAFRRLFFVATLFLLVLDGWGSSVEAQTASEARGGEQRTAHWYMGTYSNEVLVWDEATEEVVDRVPVKHAIPTRISVSKDRSRLFVLDAFFETMEIVALDSKESLGEFTLSEGDTRRWIAEYRVHPSNTWMAMTVRSRTRLADRYRIDEPVLLAYDLESYSVRDTIPWPDDDADQIGAFRFSPDGETLYMFADDLVAVDSETYEELDRWEISEPFEPGLGRMSLPFAQSPYQEAEGVYTGLFRMRDPVQNRNLMGVATVDMAAQNVDFRPIGPSDGVTFSLSPDGTKGYGLKSQIGSYELWKFDLDAGRVDARIPFAGRPRMALMPSANGEYLYIYNAGNTIDIYDEENFEYLRTVEFDADMTRVVVVPDPGR